MNLNYEEIKTVANRKYIRENFKQSGKVAYWIPLKDISIREGFNNREDYGDIEEFAELLMEGYDEKENKLYLITPLDLDVLPNGVNYIFRGHRRHKALTFNVSKWLINENTSVQFYPTASEVTEYDRKTDQVKSNSQKVFTLIETAKTVWEAKNNYSETPLSHEQVAKDLKLSRQTVDNYIAIYEASDFIRNEIRVGAMSMNKALEFIRNQRKLSKQTDKAEENSLQSGMYVSGTKDELAGELKELAELENTPIPEEETEEEKSQRELREQTKRQQAREQLLEVSDEINVSSGTLEQHIGKKLSADVLATWVDNFLDEDTGELIPVDRKKVVVYKGNILTEEIAADILAEKVDTIFVYKKGKEPIAESVITVEPGQKEKSRYDNNRLEIQQIQNCIGLADRLETIINKLDVPEGTKKDVSDIVSWLQKDLQEAREYIHKNNRVNKTR